MESTHVNNCLVCSKEVSPGRVALPEDFNLLELLCRTLRFPSVAPFLSRMRLAIENSSFCGDCSVKILESTNILSQIQILENSLEQARRQLRNSIMSSVGELSSASSQKSGEEKVKDVGSFVRKLFTQCWSKCSVEIPRIREEEYYCRYKTQAGGKGRGRRKEIPFMKQSQSTPAIFSPEVEGTTVDEDRDDLDFFEPTDSEEVVEYDPGKPSEERSKEGKGKKNQEKQFLCPDCGKGYRCQEFFDAHRKTHTGLLEFPCEHCEKKFSLNRSLVNHKRLVHKDLKVDESEESLKNRRSEKRRLRPSVVAEWKKRNSNKPFICDECGKGYGSQSFFEAHLKTHEGELAFPCEHCDKKFSMRRYLLNHNRVTHNITNRVNNGSSKLCIYCGLDFLKLHELSSSEPEVGENSLLIETEQGCKPDSAPFSQAQEPDRLKWSDEKKIRDHLRTCSENPRIKYKGTPSSSKMPCDQCDKKFHSLHALRCHIVKIHHKEYKLYCEMCGAGFLIPAALKRHMECVHTLERKFACEFCELRFKTRFQLIYHRRRHTGELPFTCEMCGKSFPTSDKLKLHSSVHVEDKRFPCPECGKLFKSKHYVQNHIYLTHKRARKNRVKKTKQPSDPDLDRSAFDISETSPGKIPPESSQVPELEEEDLDLYLTC